MFNSDETEQTNAVANPVKKAEANAVQGESSEEKYSIYNHLKSHPTSAIAAFSALVAIITFFAQLMTYIINKNVLDYWGFNVSYASLGNDSLLYSAISAIVYGLVLALSIVIYLKTCDAYLDRKRYFLTLKYVLKQQQKCEKKNLKLLNIAKQANYQIEELDKIEAEMKKIVKERIKLERSEKSREEALDTAYSYITDSVSGEGNYRLRQRAFRYVYIKGASERIAVSADYEYLSLEEKGSFICAQCTVQIFYIGFVQYFTDKERAAPVYDESIPFQGPVSIIGSETADIAELR